MERLGGRVERVEIGRFKAADDHGNVVGTIVEFKEACFVHTVNGNLIDISAGNHKFELSDGQRFVDRLPDGRYKVGITGQILHRCVVLPAAAEPPKPSKPSARLKHPPPPEKLRIVKRAIRERGRPGRGGVALKVFGEHVRLLAGGKAGYSDRTIRGYVAYLAESGQI